MLEQQITTIERFYELYANCFHAGMISTQDWDLISELQALAAPSSEMQDMLKRLFHGIQQGRIQSQLFCPLTVAA